MSRDHLRQTSYRYKGVSRQYMWVTPSCLQLFGQKCTPFLASLFPLSCSPTWQTMRPRRQRQTWLQEQLRLKRESQGDQT